VNSSLKFKVSYKISVVQDKFLVFLNLLWVPDKTRSGTGSGPRVVHPWSTGLFYYPVTCWIVEYPQDESYFGKVWLLLLLLCKDHLTRKNFIVTVFKSV